MKTYTFWLPVFKQGDDLGIAIKNANDNITEGLLTQAKTYMQASDMCKKLAAIAAKHKLEIYACTHNISVNCENESLLESLVGENLLHIEEYEDEDNE